MMIDYLDQLGAVYEPHGLADWKLYDGEAEATRPAPVVGYADVVVGLFAV